MFPLAFRRLAAPGDDGTTGAWREGFNATHFGTAVFSLAPVPEPGTYALMLGGLAAIGAAARRRRA